LGFHNGGPAAAKRIDYDSVVITECLPDFGFSFLNEALVLVSLKRRQTLHKSKQAGSLLSGGRTFTRVIHNRREEHCSPRGHGHGRKPLVKVSDMACFSVLILLTTAIDGF
jgi:hypothetical protein